MSSSTSLSPRVRAQIASTVSLVLSLPATRVQTLSVREMFVLCQQHGFAVDITVVHATGGEVVAGSLTATNALSGVSATAPFQAPVPTAGASGTSVQVTVRFTGCPEGTASATTRPASAAASATRFGDCDLLSP